LLNFFFPCRIGFVTQDDVLFPQLTVEETLVFSAFLRLPSNMSQQQKYARVEMIVKELGLERYVLDWSVARDRLCRLYSKKKVLFEHIFIHFLCMISCVTLDVVTQE
jgi:ABC-type multidrug transport system ATPase subunit